MVRVCARSTGSSRSCVASQAGQGTLEYIGAVLAVALIFGSVAALAGDRLPGGQLARAVVGQLVCAVDRGTDCDPGIVTSPLAAAYGSELAAQLRARTPTIGFEAAEFASLPVDFRRCRERSCADTSVLGTLQHSFGGERPTIFTHVVDCRPGSPGVGASARADCSGARAGYLYIQYWLYYPDSATRPFGARGYHRDDWESYQVRIGADGTVNSRASSHNGYNDSRTGPRNVLSDLGKTDDPRWGSGYGHLRVSHGSHAGSIEWDADAPWRIEPGAFRLIPIESLLPGVDAESFAVTPPWRKKVWLDPESPDTN